MGLRLTEGIDRLALGEDGNILSNINRLIDMGLLQNEAGRLRTTLQGRPVLNAILREIFA